MTKKNCPPHPAPLFQLVRQSRPPDRSIVEKCANGRSSAHERGDGHPNRYGRAPVGPTHTGPQTGGATRRRRVCTCYSFGRLTYQIQIWVLSGFHHMHVHFSPARSFHVRSPPSSGSLWWMLLSRPGALRLRLVRRVTSEMMQKICIFIIFHSSSGKVSHPHCACTHHSKI